MSSCLSDFAMTSMVTMKRNVKNAVPLLVCLVLVCTVNLSNAYAIKEPGSYTASFSGSSSSASAFSHASSSSYSFNGGNVDPHALAGAVAKASAVAGTGTDDGQAVAGAVAGAHSHSGANLAQGSNAVSGASAGAGSSGSDCSGSHGCTSTPIDTGSYKVIEEPKYATGYSGNGGAGAKTNYAVSGNYAQQTAGGCQTCQQTHPGLVHQPQPAIAPSSIHHHTSSSSGSKSTSFQHYQHISPSLVATFPGPSGSILDSKPVGAVAHAAANSGTYHVPSVPAGIPKANAGLHEIIAILPGSSGSIYDSKPVKGHGSGSYNTAGSGSTSYNHQAGSVPCGAPNNNCGGQHQVLPGPSGSVHHAQPVVVPSGSTYNVPASTHVLPGPSGSIHDSKPVGSGSSANAGATSTSYNVPASHPVAVPSGSAANANAGAAAGSSYNVPAQPCGSPNKNCDGQQVVLPGPSGSVHHAHPVVVPATNANAGSSYNNGPASHSVVGSTHVFPGPSGSIHDSKPVGSGSSANAGAVAGSTSTSYNIPAAHPVVGPVPTPSGSSHVFPGPSGSIHDGKPVAGVSGSGSSSNAGAVAGSTSTSYNIPTSHPVVGPACSYTPGSLNQCGSSGSGAHHVFPGPSGSIHDSKPVAGVSGSGSSANAGAVATSTSYNVPASHPAVGPACSYTPGSPNKCGSAAGSGAHHVFPGPSGSIHDSKLVGGVSGSGSSANAGTVATSTSYEIPASGPGVLGSGSSANAGAVATSTSYDIPSASVPGCSYAPGSPNKCVESPSDSYNGVGSITYNPYSAQTSVPTKEPSNSGTYYIDKPSVDIQPPLSSAAPSFSGQIPCKDNSCGSSHGIVYDDKDRTGQYQQINHDDAHLSGGIVYQNEDGSYAKSPATSKPVYKNSEHGGYAVSNSEDHGGILIGPGTGSLPVEDDKVPFGAGPGGSDTYAKTTAEKNVPFGSGPGGSDTFSKNSAGVSHHSQSGSDVKSVPFGSGPGGSDTFAKNAAGASHAQSGSDVKSVPFGSGLGGSNTFAGSDAHGESHKTSDGFASGSVIIQKSDGIAVTPTESEKPSCSSGNCGHGQVQPSGSGNFGFATGQVLVNQGANAYDITNSGSNEIVGINKESHGSGSGCKGGCSGQGLAFGVSSGGLLNTLFGHGGLSGSSGSGYQKFGGGYGGSGAYSSSGSYASAGSFAGASAHAGSYAGSF